MNQRTVLFVSALSLLSAVVAPRARGDEATAPARSTAEAQNVQLTGPCAFYDGRRAGAAAHFAPGVLVLTSDALRIHTGATDSPAAVVLRFTDMQGAALRRYAGERQVQIRTAEGVVVIETTGRAGQPDTDAVMSELRKHRVPFWDSGRFYRRR